jgi:plastocyanin
LLGPKLLCMKKCVCTVFMLIFIASLPVVAETLTGKVEITSKLPKVSSARKTRVSRNSYDDEDYPERRTRKPKTRDEVQSVVISVLDLSDKGAKKGGTMRQKGKVFHPYVLPVVVGSDVDFPNDDKIYHGVYSESKAQAFELPQYANGESRSITFQNQGVVELYCHIHAHMNAYIVVLGNSFFDMPDKSHEYAIDGLPPGKYKVKAWHPRLGSKLQIVEVKAGQKTTADFSL